MADNFNLTRDQFPALEQAINGQTLHYLDNAATTQLPHCVIDAVANYEINSRANVQRGSHSLAERATLAYEDSRSTVASFINAKSPQEVIFTSGTTASINMLANMLAQHFSAGDEIVLSQAEHHSNLVPWLMLRDRIGVKLCFLPVMASGQIDLSQLSQLVTNRCKLIAVTHCSNVTGLVTPVKPLAEAAHAVGAWLLLDGAQAVAHKQIDVQSLDADFYVFSGHKCYAPNGIGVLWGRQQILQQLSPAWGGGGMIETVSEQGVSYAQGVARFEAGTPAIAQAIGLAAALKWLNGFSWASICDYEQRLQKRMLKGLSDIPHVELLLSDKSHDYSFQEILPVVSFNLKNIHPHDVCHLLNESGVALRGGHHCAQLLMKVLSLSSINRSSLAIYNNEHDVDALLNGIEAVIRALK